MYAYLESVHFIYNKDESRFIPTVTRSKERLTFAMKKRPTSGNVTHIRTLNYDARTSTSKVGTGNVVLYL